MTIEEKRAAVLKLEKMMNECDTQDEWVALFGEYETVHREYMAALAEAAASVLAETDALQSAVDDYQAAQVDRVDSMPRADDDE